MTIRKPNIGPSDDPLVDLLSHRPRRLRRLPGLRRLVRETILTPADFIYPLFVVHGTGVERAIESMPGQAHRSIDRLPAVIDAVVAAGVPGVILFGLPAAKDAAGSENFAADGIVQQAIRAIKARAPELIVMTDVCLCEYTDHGHCGILGVDAHGHGPIVLNDATLPVLGRVAVSHAAAGADVVAPSGMMDGMVGAIRFALDHAGFSHLPLMSYAAKYSSAFYGPFRDAAESAPQFGDRRTYQMDPAAAAGQALREVELDLREGADMVMVKPALAYLDIIRDVRENFPGVPLAAYNVSGEYSLVKAAAANGWVDERTLALEMLTAIKRAGASIILTYWAKDVARWLA